MRDSIFLYCVEFHLISLMRFLLNDFYICTFIFLEFPFYYFIKDLGKLGEQFKLKLYKFIPHCKKHGFPQKHRQSDTFRWLTISEPHEDYMVFQASLDAIKMNTMLNTLFISELDGEYMYKRYRIL